MRFLAVHALLLLVSVQWSSTQDVIIPSRHCTYNLYEINSTKYPMVLNPYYRYKNAWNRTSEGFLYIPHGEELVLHCVNDFNFLENFTVPTKTVSLSCQYGNFHTRGRKLSDFTCLCSPVRGEVFESSPCAGENSYSFELGFKLLFGRTARITEGCYDSKYQRTLHTTHQLDGTSFRWSYQIKDGDLGESKERASSRFFDFFLDGFRNLITINYTYNDVAIIKDSFQKGTKKAAGGDEQFNRNFYTELYEFSVTVADEEMPFEEVMEKLKEKFLNKDLEAALESVDKERENSEAKFLDEILQVAFDSSIYPLNDPTGAKGKERELLVDKDKFDLMFHLMAPHGDFADPYLMEGSYSQINLVPMFRSIAFGNWKALGTRIRHTAISTKATYVITTGQEGILKYPHKDKRFHELFLGQDRTVPVPKFIYKIVVEPKTHKAIVFVLYNSQMQFITRDPCTNICKVPGGPDDDSFELEKPEEGYIICCSLDDFLLNFPTAPRPAYYIDSLLHIRP